MTLKSNFELRVRPVTQQFLTADDTCGPPAPGAICPYAYDSVSDWYRGDRGPTFILIDPEMVRLNQPPADSLEAPTAVYKVDRFTIYVYADDVAAHMGTPRKFTRPLL